MLSKNSPGCGPCCDEGPCAMVCTNAFDSCSHTAIAGASVTLTQGATVTGPCTTDVAGRCCNGSASGAYSVTVTASGYITKTVTGTAKCPPPPTPVAYGPRYPGTWADDSTIGTGAWVSPSNAASANSTFATAPSQGNTPTHYLKGTASGSFAIPTDGTEAIYRVRVEVGCKADAASTDHDVRLVLGGTIQATSKAVGTALSTSLLADLRYAWTAPADLPTIAQANAGDIGLVFSVRSPGSGSGTPTNTGATYGAATDGGGGVDSWTSPGNASASDATFATCVLARDDTTNFLRWTSLGLAVPTGSTINGLVFEANVKATASGCADLLVYAVKGGVQAGTQQAAGTAIGTSAGTITYGSSSNLWGTTWTVSDVNAGNFGFDWQGTNTTAGSKTISVDYGRCTVYYTPPGSTTISVDYGRIYVDTTRTTYEITVPLARDCAPATHIAPCCDPVPDPLHVTLPSNVSEWGAAAGTTIALPYSGFGFAANVWRWGPVAVDNSAGGFYTCAVVMVQLQFLDVCHGPAAPVSGSLGVSWGFLLAPFSCAGKTPAELVPYANRHNTSWAGTVSCPIAFTATRNPSEVFVVSE